MAELKTARHPRFVTLEGGEGAGKSTQARHMASWLEAHGHTVRLTRQPGGTPIAESIRRLLKDTGHDAMAPMTELLLLFAARAQFLEEVVRPALAAGEVVVCDRFTDSTYAYQGGGRGLPAEDIAVLEQLVHGDLQPGLTLLFDLDVDEGHRRASSRGEADRFEREERAFFERVRAAYRALASEQPERFRIIDASGDEAAVRAAVERQLERHFS